MKQAPRIPILVLGLMLFGAAPDAHHSIANYYDHTQRVTLECVVVQFQFINPHPLVTVEVKNTDGKAERWRLEMDNRWELAALGFHSQALKRGDRIVITGDLARTEPRSLYVRKLERPSDGFSYEHHP